MKKVLLISLLLISYACGDSHRVNKDNLDTSTQEVTTNCEIYFKSEDLCLEANWEVMPTADTFGSMILKFTLRSDPSIPLSPQSAPFILLWMSSMGHGSSPVTMTLIEEGIYKASEVFFIMPGPWEIHYQLRDEHDVVEEHIEKIII